MCVDNCSVERERQSMRTKSLMRGKGERRWILQQNSLCLIAVLVVGGGDGGS